MREVLRNLVELDLVNRGCGKTSAMARIVKELNGVLLVGSDDHKKMIEVAFPNIRVQNAHSPIRGKKGPFVSDHFLVSRAANWALAEITRLEKEVAALKVQSDRREMQFEMYVEQIKTSLENKYKDVSMLAKRMRRLSKEKSDALFDNAKHLIHSSILRDESKPRTKN